MSKRRLPLDPGIELKLRERGVDLELLRQVEVVAPAPEFLAGEEGRRWKRCARGRSCSGGIVLGLWGTLHSDSQNAQLLRESRFNADIAEAILHQLPENPPPVEAGPTITPLDVLKQIRPAGHSTPAIPSGLDDVAGEILLAAWDLCGRREIQPYDLLSGMIYIGYSLETEAGAFRILKDLEVFEDLDLAFMFYPRVTLIDGCANDELRLGEESREIVELARRQAVDRVGSAHLLWALAASPGQGLVQRILRATGLTAEKIQARLPLSSD